jgi:hypothetical protein
MPRSYLSRLETKPVKKAIYRDDEMTPENKIAYIEAMEDYKNNTNIVSWEEIKSKYA